MLSVRSSTSGPNSGLSDAEKITLYIVATLAALMIFLGVTIGILRSRRVRDCERQARARSTAMLKGLPVVQYEASNASEKSLDMEGHSNGLSNSTCPVCTEDFVRGQLLRVLPCQHQYHLGCIQDWLTRGSNCPIWYVLLINSFEIITEHCIVVLTSNHMRKANPTVRLILSKVYETVGQGVPGSLFIGCCVISMTSGSVNTPAVLNTMSYMSHASI